MKSLHLPNKRLFNHRNNLIIMIIMSLMNQQIRDHQKMIFLIENDCFIEAKKEDSNIDDNGDDFWN